MAWQCCTSAAGLLHVHMNLHEKSTAFHRPGDLRRLGWARAQQLQGSLQALRSLEPQSQSTVDHSRPISQDIPRYSKYVYTHVITRVSSEYNTIAMQYNSMKYNKQMSRDLPCNLRELWQCVSGRGSRLIRCYAACELAG